jgi:hypothetical protein
MMNLGAIPEKAIILTPTMMEIPTLSARHRD